MKKRSKTARSRSMAVKLVIILIMALTAGSLFTACEMDSPYLDAILKQILVDSGFSDTFSVTYYGNGNDGGIAPTDAGKYKDGNTSTALGTGQANRTAMKSQAGFTGGTGVYTD